MSKSSLAKKTGFFSLPLEIRQLIYSEILPSNRLLVISRPVWRLKGPARTIDAVCNADRRLQSELWHWCQKHCDVSLIITSKYSVPPNWIRFDELPKFELLIEHYELRDLADTPLEVAALRDQVHDVAESLRRFPRLQEVTVRFRRDRSSEHGTRDGYWTRQLRVHGISRTFLTNIEDRNNRIVIPIVAWVSQPLLNLPRCQTVTIVPLSGVASETALTNFAGNYVPLAKGREYMIDLFRAFAERLEKKSSTSFFGYPSSAQREQLLLQTTQLSAADTMLESFLTKLLNLPLDLKRKIYEQILS